MRLLARIVALRALLFAVMLPLGAAVAWPGYAEALGGGPVHRCHCRMIGGESTCSCPLCHPFDPAYRTSDDALRGKCGDDYDDSTRGLASPVVPAVAALSRLAVPERAAIPAPDQLRPDDPETQPPVPPPRTRAV